MCATKNILKKIEEINNSAFWIIRKPVSSNAAEHFLFAEKPTPICICHSEEGSKMQQSSGGNSNTRKTEWLLVHTALCTVKSSCVRTRALCHFQWRSFIMLVCAALGLPASWSMGVWTRQHSACWPSTTQRAALCCAWSTPLASCLRACRTERWWFMEEITAVRCSRVDSVHTTGLVTICGELFLLFTMGRKKV